ncbi:hypothetical protein [uncultured Paraglaciecola sp.]|jgi:hypothetical protein|uniref:hypothetical protein n=1 Tax=uncultured Paraglaciecola sp. TaxID=1765024 RepID=UPI0025CDEEB1|nr:hypothetical protein [uncultured Paraglaciecola sp.]
MSPDLLFSILPREGKVPIAHDSQKVAKIDRQEVLRALSDKEKELKGEEKDAREKQQQQNERKPDHKKVIKESNVSKHKKPKGPKHLDVYV